MIPYCNAHGIGLIPWGPLHAGDLARAPDATSTRKESRKGTVHERKFSDADTIIVNRVQEIAEKKGWTMGQVALAWIDKKVSSPIVGISSVRTFLFCTYVVNLLIYFVFYQVERLEANVITGKDLTDEEVKYLEEP